MTKDKTVDENNEKNQEELDTSKEETNEEKTSEESNEKSKDDTKDDSKNTAEESDKGKDDSEKEKEIDPYEAKLKEVEEGLKFEKTKNKQKSGALKEEREFNKALEARLSKLEKAKTDDFEDEEKESKVDLSGLASKDEVKKLHKQIRINKELTEIQPKITSVAEKKLIMIYVDKGYSVTDAYLKANEHLVDKIKADRKKRIDSEDEMLDMSGSQNYSKSDSPTNIKTKGDKATADFLDDIGVPEAKEYINK